MSFIQQSFDRIAVLKVFATKETPAGPNGKTLSKIDPIGKAFPSKLEDGSPGFRIKFHIEKSSGPVPVPNPSTIYIYNLGPDSRALVSKLNNFLVLETGYGTNTQVLFKGNISYARTKKDGPDYVTEIHAGDGLFAFQNSLINQSFDKNTTAAAVINTLVGSLSGAGINPGLSTGVPTSIYNQGIVLSGKVVDKIKEVCEKNNLTFTIEDQTITVLPIGGAKASPPVILTPSTGLIGIPEVREATVAGNKSLISFRCLQNPQIGTFQLVVIQSKFINGFFTTAKIVHTGDTFGTEWYTDGEAT